MKECCNRFYSINQKNTESGEYLQKDKKSSALKESDATRQSAHTL
jgi:hypothetical protein